MTLTTPAPGRAITSPFGWRTHPITGKRALHRGIDWGGAFRVQLAGRGRIVKVGYSATGFGHYVIAEHDADGVKLRTVYAHGAARSQLVTGRTYDDGATVFTSGSTGSSTGNHLHFEVRKRNRFGVWTAVDPMPYLTASTQSSARTIERKRRTWLG